MNVYSMKVALNPCVRRCCASISQAHLPEVFSSDVGPWRQEPGNRRRQLALHSGEKHEENRAQ